MCKHQFCNMLWLTIFVLLCCMIIFFIWTRVCNTLLFVFCCTCTTFIIIYHKRKVMSIKWQVYMKRRISYWDKVYCQQCEKCFFTARFAWICLNKKVPYSSRDINYRVCVLYSEMKYGLNTWTTAYLFWQDRTTRLIFRLVKETQFCVSFIPLWV